ncbi:MAG: hypothetical protein HY063_01885 [Bacteroidetes bacterium]|nr:hypothetical protein [Bacteroidota bacterium]
MQVFKKLLLLFVLLPSLLIAVAAEGPLVKKFQAKRILRRTAVVILMAHKKVKEGKVYTGNLARAIAHQHYAIRLYREGKFFRAIHQSRRARMLALMAIQANKGAETAEMKYEKEDENALKGGPGDEELDKEVAKELPAEAAAKDEEVVAAEPAVDLKEDE